MLAQDEVPHQQLQAQLQVSCNSRVANQSEERLEQSELPLESTEGSQNEQHAPNILVTNLGQMAAKSSSLVSKSSSSPSLPSESLISGHFSRMKRFLNRFVLITNSHYRSYELGQCEGDYNRTLCPSNPMDSTQSPDTGMSHSNSEQVHCLNKSNN